MRYLKYLAILYLYFYSVQAQSQLAQNIQAIDLGKENKQLSQKFRMAHYLLKHKPLIKSITSSSNNIAIRLLHTAQSNYELVGKKINKKNWLEANAIIDSVLRDLTTSAQLINEKKISLNYYRENLKRVDSFVLPEWSDLSQEDQKQLNENTGKIDYLIDRAEKLAENKKYKNASALLDKAYELKTHLLNNLKHESNIIYDLKFDTPEEECDYLLKRSLHFLSLADNVLKYNSFDTQKKILIDMYIKRGRLGMENTRNKIKNKQYAQAIKILENSIKDLSRALKFMGIKI